MRSIDENKQHGKEGHEQSEVRLPSGAWYSVIPEIIRCPKCDSPNIGKQDRPFRINGVVFIVLLFSSVSVLCLDMCVPFVLLFVALLVSFFCLFVTNALAHIGSRRCRTCGHYFYRAGRSELERTNSRSGFRYAVLGGAILFMSFVVGPTLIVLSSGGIIEATVKVATSAVIWLLIAGACLLLNIIVWAILKTKVTNRLIWALLFLLPAIVLSPLGLHDSLPRERAQKALSAWDLASLPESARQIRFYRAWWPDEVRCYLVFSADPEEIETFLETSPAVRSDEFQLFSNESSYRSSAGRLSTLAELRKNDRGLCSLDGSAPEWHKLEIRSSGRRYKVLEEDRQSFGEIIVDDEEHAVFIRLGWGD